MEERGDRQDLGLVVGRGDNADVGGDVNGTVGRQVATHHAVGGEADGAHKGERGVLVDGLGLGIIGNCNIAGEAGVIGLELGGDLRGNLAGELGARLGGGVIGVRRVRPCTRG